MIIHCPHCGPRDLIEFSYCGDATLTRPDPASTDQAAWNAYVYQRKIPQATTANTGSIPAAAGVISSSPAAR